MSAPGSLDEAQRDGWDMSPVYCSECGRECVAGPAGIVEGRPVCSYYTVAERTVEVPLEKVRRRYRGEI